MDVPTLYPPLVTLPPKRKPIFLGKAIAGANIKVCRTNHADDILAETTADTNGSWLVRSNKELPFGKNSISAYYDKKKGYAPNLEFYIEGPVVVQGNQLQPADIIESPAISYLLPAGSAPIILSPQSGMTLPSPSFIISGQAPANTSVRLFTQDNTNLGVANADEKGDWSVPIELPLTTRDVVIRAAIFTTNGSQASAWSMNSLFQIQSVFFSIDGFFNKLFLKDEDSSLPYGSVPIIDEPKVGQPITTLRPTFKGRAAPNTEIRIAKDDWSFNIKPIKVDPQGFWQIQAPVDLPVASDGTIGLLTAQYEGQNYTGAMASAWSEPYRFTVKSQTPPVQNSPPYMRHYNGTPDPSVERARVGNWYMHSDRQSTGLYLAPGAQMQLDVQLNNTMGNVQASVVIGMPFTNPNVNSGWYPKVNAYPLSAGPNIVSDPEGGMVYVVLQGQGNSATITFKTGILAAPFFEYGKTSIQQYREMIRTSTQVPYTELVSSRITLTAEREIVASLLLDDPNTLLETLETIIEIQEHTLGLDGSSPLHTAPALKFHLTYGNYHGAGGAHTFDFYTTYAYPQIFSVEGLKSTFWIGHELGHPLQMIGYLAYPELAESTNNIGAQAVQRHFGAPSVLLAPDANGKSDWDRALEKIKVPGLVFSQLQHFEQLVMFEQLRLAFGDDFWPRVNKVTREHFHQLGAPTDGRYLLKWDAAIDNLILFSSIATRYDLRSYFFQWALHATAQGSQNVANLGMPPPPFDPTTIRA